MAAATVTGVQPPYGRFSQVASQSCRCRLWFKMRDVEQRGSAVKLCLIVRNLVRLDVHPRHKFGCNF